MFNWTQLLQISKGSTLFWWYTRHCISLTPRKNTISAIFSVLFAFLSPSSRSLIQFLYFSIITHDERTTRPICDLFWDSAVYFIFDLVSSTISQNCRHFEVLSPLCPINVTSSSSCVFILSNPTVLYTIEFLKVILSTSITFQYKNPPT